MTYTGKAINNYSTPQEFMLQSLEKKITDGSIAEAVLINIITNANTGVGVIGESYVPMGHFINAFYSGIKNYILTFDDRHLLSQIDLFIANLSGEKLSYFNSLEISTFKKSLRENPETYYKVVTNIILRLRRNTENEKNIMYANVFAAFIAKKIDADKFYEMYEVISRLFISDCEYMRLIWEGHNKSINDVDYRLDRLVALGVAKTTTLLSNTMFVTFENEETEMFSLTSFGKEFYEIISNNNSIKYEDFSLWDYFGVKDSQ